MISTYYSLDASFRYTPEEGDELSMQEVVDKVVDHLYELDVEDLSVILDNASRLVHVSLVVGSHSGDSIETVVGKGMGSLRTAFHACEQGTPSWPSSAWEMLQTVTIDRIPGADDVSVAEGQARLAAV